MMFGAPDDPQPELSEDMIFTALAEIKADARNRRIALAAPMALAAAMLAAFIATPPQYGGLTLAPDADASDQAELPRVFGSNGVWRLAEPIGDPVQSLPGPPWMVDFPSEPASPEYVLVPPVEPISEDSAHVSDPAAADTSESSESLSASASSPPTPTLGQSEQTTVPDQLDEIDWSKFQPVIRVEADHEESPVAVAPAQAATPPTSSSTDEHMSGAATPRPEPIGDVAGAFALETADAEDPAEANPSTPQLDSIDSGAQPSSVVATIVSQSVLVHSAHVSITVQVIDDDSSVIHNCNTRVDWGDGSVTGLPGPDGEAGCTVLCEQQASPSVVGLNEILTFTHDYSIVIDAAARIYVATGDGCSYSLAELQLNPFTVAPY